VQNGIRHRQRVRTTWHQVRPLPVMLIGCGRPLTQATLRLSSGSALFTDRPGFIEHESMARAFQENVSCDLVTLDEVDHPLIPPCAQTCDADEHHTNARARLLRSWRHLLLSG
jgi:hypothetical protein